MMKRSRVPKHRSDIIRPLAVVIICLVNDSRALQGIVSTRQEKTRLDFIPRILDASVVRRSRPTSARPMVLTTPESIIEQASTQKLLDDLIDESVRTSARRPIMLQFDPSSSFIWRRWKGTVFSETWVSCVRNMIYAAVVLMFTRLFPGLREHFSGFNILWGQILSVTTFTLTFFLNQSYALWRKCYELSRRLQGRLNDLGMTLAAHAARKTPSSPSEPSTYTSASRQLLELMGRYIRVFNLLTYASFTRSHRPILTPRGMRRLVERGLLTPGERQALVEAEVPATQRHNAVILWIIRCFVEGRNAGIFAGGAGFEGEFLEKIHVIRAQYGAIGDELQGRMPLAYAHIVQILVDVILWMYPFMAFSTNMNAWLGILGTGLLTMSYQGLFDLAKQFLDPYDNENYGKGDDPLCVDTLIAETNSGSVRWMNGFDQMPFSSQRIKDAELFDYLLPLRGYSVEELAIKEEEKAQKEKELQEKREREEAERARLAEEEMMRHLNETVNAANVSLFVNGTVGAASNETIFEHVPMMNAAQDSPVESAAEETIDQDELIDIAAVTQPEVDDESTAGNRVISLGNGLPYIYSYKKEDSGPTPPSSATRSASEEALSRMATSFTPTDLAGATIAAAVALASPKSKASDVNEEAALHSSLGDMNSSEGQDQPVVVNGVYPNMFLKPDFNFFDSMRDVNWYDEVGDDGQEYRLSQMMADEEWDEEIDYQEEQRSKEPPMSFEEYRESVVELIEAAADELKETRDVLSGTDSEPARKRKQAPLMYDQTKLDGISQLWGLPPQDPSALEVVEEPTQVSYEENSFDTIMTLWGKPPLQFSQEEGPTIIGSNFKGVSELWDSSNKEIGPVAGLSDLPWMNEVDSDGKEYRLSQMLAEEEWVDEAFVIEAPLTLEDYSKKAQEAYEDVEKELKETEAILNAPPGAYDYEEQDRSEKEDNEECNLSTDSALRDTRDASSEIRAEVQAAYAAAKEEETKIGLELERRLKIEEDPLSFLFDDEGETVSSVKTGESKDTNKETGGEDSAFLADEMDSDEVNGSAKPSPEIGGQEDDNSDQSDQNEEIRG